MHTLEAYPKEVYFRFNGFACHNSTNLIEIITFENNEWEATTDCNWVRIASWYGTGEGVIRISCEPTEEYREGQITIRSEAKPAVVTVSQNYYGLGIVRCDLLCDSDKYCF